MGVTSLRLQMGHLLKPNVLGRATHSTKCHIHNMYFDKTKNKQKKQKCESLKLTKRDFDEFVLQRFQNIIAYYPFALYINMYVFWYKKN